MAEFHDKYPGQVANLVEFWLWTGMRTSEVVGLNWNNVEHTSGMVLVAESMVRGVRKSNTKTNVARLVKLNSRAQAALQRQRLHTQMVGNEVFENPRYFTLLIDEWAFRRSYWTPCSNARASVTADLTTCVATGAHYRYFSAYLFQMD